MHREIGFALRIAHQLDRNRTLQSHIDGAIHLAHAAAADQAFEAIVLNCRGLHEVAGDAFCGVYSLPAMRVSAL
jgi:hypothetical protein